MSRSFPRSQMRSKKKLESDLEKTSFWCLEGLCLHKLLNLQSLIKAGASGPSHLWPWLTSLVTEYGSEITTIVHLRKYSQTYPFPSSLLAFSLFWLILNKVSLNEQADVGHEGVGGPERTFDILTSVCVATWALGGGGGACMGIWIGTPHTHIHTHIYHGEKHLSSEERGKKWQPVWGMLSNVRQATQPI